ncbi:MAG: FKBP-type peptidyl-prolyl cis-trans isomerase [Sphingobium sp.]|nr:FKBP-type peptidyl-prolyl cis-trans isomerase [Sphingobium sp.]
MSEVTAVPLRPIAKGSVRNLWLGVGLVGVVAIGLACTGQHFLRSGPDGVLFANAGKPGVVTLQSGVQYKVIEEGKGETPAADDVALVDYKGTLPDGTVFDSGSNAVMPLSRTVPGFAEGISHMKRGGKYMLWIPPREAYGDNPPPQSNIPANTVLTFEITLRDFTTAQQFMMMQQQLQAMQGMNGAGGPPHGGAGAPPVEAPKP